MSLMFWKHQKEILFVSSSPTIFSLTRDQQYFISLSCLLFLLPSILLCSHEDWVGAALYAVLAIVSTLSDGHWIPDYKCLHIMDNWVAVLGWLRAVVPTL